MAGSAAGDSFPNGSVVNRLDIGHAGAIDQVDIFQIVTQRAFRMTPTGGMFRLGENKAGSSVQKIPKILSFIRQAPSAGGQQKKKKEGRVFHLLESPLPA